jgi:hypothetical protein
VEEDITQSNSRCSLSSILWISDIDKCVLHSNRDVDGSHKTKWKKSTSTNVHILHSNRDVDGSHKTQWKKSTSTNVHILHSNRDVDGSNKTQWKKSIDVTSAIRSFHFKRRRQIYATYKTALRLMCEYQELRSEKLQPGFWRVTRWVIVYFG